MARTDPFIVPKRRLGRAKQGVRTLVNSGNTFFAKKPYAEVVETDSETLERVYKIKLTKKLPNILHTVAHETIEHLRAVLDQCGYVAAELSGKIGPKRAYFPIADSAQILKNDVIDRGRCNDLPSDVLNLFRSFNPYKGGNDAIWALNRLCNTSKHKLLTAALFCPGFSAVGPGFISNGRIIIPQWDAEKNEIVFARISPGGSFQYNFDFAFHITVGEVAELAGEPLFPMLNSMATEVGRILIATEAECARLGILI